MPKTIEIETPHGLARAYVHDAAKRARLAMVLSHGAGGGLNAPDIVAATEVATAWGVRVALVEQPYRVAGRPPAPAKQLDAAWLAIVEHLTGEVLSGLPLIAGGRSMGSRVACRTAADTNTAAVLCLAFPLMPPQRGGAAKSPRPSRLPELDAVRVPTLVVQGERDPFGMPPPGPNRTVVVVPGDHSLKKDLEAVRVAIAHWLQAVALG